MNRLSRILMAAAAVVLIFVYLVPIWRISLEAPQYPEGLGMQIWINTVTGEDRYDLGKINNLNHYIGMKVIEPDTIPELKMMPYILAGLIITALLIAAFGGRRLVIVWLVVFSLLGIAGMYDFYLWEYDYGHNLDTENAIIKVPGMNYQPPLLGSKKLLNFTATSLPAAGGYLMLLSMLLGFAALLVKKKDISRTENHHAVPTSKTKPAAPPTAAPAVGGVQS